MFAMSNYPLEWQTILDISVNIVPLIMLALFFALFAVYDPYYGNPFMLGVALFLLVIPFVSLAFLTYIAGRTIEDEEAARTTEPEER